MRFKEATREQLEAMAEIYMETFNAPPWDDAWTKETAEKRLLQMISHQGAFGICCYQEEEMCGMMVGEILPYYNGMRYELKEFCTRNSMRGKGIGTCMFQELEKRLEEKQVGYLYLTTARGPLTEGFYEKMGMKRDTLLIVMNKDIPG